MRGLYFQSLHEKVGSEIKNLCPSCRAKIHSPNLDHHRPDGCGHRLVETDARA
jgi:hypothetical protein